tara:strand:- start:157 stop:480 length:324 start_codon:yes stop_codon:yes gene_type:complete
MPKGSWREFDDSSTQQESSAIEKIYNKNLQKVRVQRTKAGKKGKTVTVISGLVLELQEAKELLQRLKAFCGTGGTFKSNEFELQGDQVNRVLEFLQKNGFRPKQAGG